MPTASIIIPVYKTLNYLKKCIDSVLNQTYTDFELILVSDGPIEEHQLCDNYAKKDNRIIVLKDIKKGLGGARNAALDIAKGEYIFFVDSDDYIENNLLERSIGAFNNEVDLVIFGANCVLDNGAKRQKGIEKYLKNCFCGLQALDEEKIFNTNVYCWNKAFRKSIIDKYNLRFPESVQYEDFPFFYSYCAYSKKAFYLEDKLYNYLQRNLSGMNKAFRGDVDRIKDHLKSLKFLHGLVDDKYYYSKIYSIITSAALRYLKSKEDKIEYLTSAHKLYKELNLDNFNISLLKFLENEEYLKIINKVDEIYYSRLFKIVKTTNNRLKLYLFNKIPVLVLKIERK